MADFAQTSYAKNGTVHIAYQVMGNGPLDLVLVPGFISHLELQLDDPRPIRFFERLSSFCRLIRFDKRGTGGTPWPLRGWFDERSFCRYPPQADCGPHPLRRDGAAGVGSRQSLGDKR